MDNINTSTEQNSEVALTSVLQSVHNNDSEMETATEPITITKSMDFGLEHLIQNYQTILRDKAIYYPVAYHLEKVLGHGRQGMVFMGVRQGARGCRTQHAIKLFDPSIYPNPIKYWTDMGRIAMQISRLQTVNSPYLVNNDSYDEINGIGYVQMEWIDGVDLSYLLSEKHLKRARALSTYEDWAHYTDVIFRIQENRVTIQPGIAVYIIRSILRGLEILHDNDYVHSDIKPANIMISRLGNIKIIDYGRAIRQNEKMTFLLGTPLYMAPETHRREPNAVQSDLFSVGLVGIEMLCGVPPIKNGSEEFLLEQKMTLIERLDEILPPHVLENTFLVEILKRFIEPDPYKRYGNAVDADAGDQGLRVIHRQLSQLGKDAEYGRELKYFMSKTLPTQTHN
ncbi:MAG: serine/threonine protein kinase [Spartobacteria bacterium]|nr:serine/threonine protein kinase [Spartobacteria bacterium]